jgi:hypothetical protein
LRPISVVLKVAELFTNSPATSLKSGSGAITGTKLMRWVAPSHLHSFKSKCCGIGWRTLRLLLPVRFPGQADPSVFSFVRHQLYLWTHECRHSGVAS